jgi:hypothetical protein
MNRLARAARVRNMISGQNAGMASYVAHRQTFEPQIRFP